VDSLGRLHLKITKVKNRYTDFVSKLHGFCRINKSYIMNLSHILSLRSRYGDTDEYEIDLRGSMKSLPVGRSYLASLREAFCSRMSADRVKQMSSSQAKGHESMSCRVQQILVALLMIAAISETTGCGEPDRPRGSRTPSPPVNPAMSPESKRLTDQMELASEQVSVTVDGLFRAMEAGTVNDFYKSRTSAEFQTVATLEAFIQMCDRVSSRLGALKHKDASQFNLNPVDNDLVASAVYEA
jgi:hypothetical protein